MTISLKPALLALTMACCPVAAPAQEKPVVGLIPKATKPIKLDGKLDDWDGAFVTPVHVGHPDFANRGSQFLFLWDEQNLYVGLRCLDQHPVHVGADHQIWNGDAVEFYLDTRRGAQLGDAQFGPGTLHSFWTPFTRTELKPRHQVRDLPAFKGFKLKGDEVIGAKTTWGYTAEFKLPWANFPEFAPKAGEIIGIDCELCSSDGGPRVDRTFVFSSPAAVSTPSAFGRVQLVDRNDLAALKPLGRALLPLSLTKSANYAWLYGTVCISPTIANDVAKLEGKILDAGGKVRKTTTGSRKTLEGSGFEMWSGSWELFDLPPGTYTVELTATDKSGKLITSRTVKVLHGSEIQEAPPKKLNPPSQAKNFTNSIGMKFAWIAPGAFVMGSTTAEKGRGDDEIPHQVSLSRGFYLGMNVVTQEQWQAVMGNNPSYLTGQKNLPVESVSWTDCQEFCRMLSAQEKKAYRLPTEAEWEYACRAGTTGPFHFGATLSTEQANYNGNFIYGNGKLGTYREKTAPVGSFAPNAWGLYDMHGNVWQWCHDWHGGYATKNPVNPQGSKAGTNRVQRGGSWGSHPIFCRSANRSFADPDSRTEYCGFRVCFTEE